jgi:hypothetical protein
MVASLPAAGLNASYCAMISSRRCRIKALLHRLHLLASK